MSRPALEVAQIFRHHGPEYRENHGLSPEQHQAMRDIERCRTASLGGHVDYCEQGCGFFAISYNSCRNRHCPKCQSLMQAKWLEERQERLLPTRYFHLVVTLPHELNPLALFNKELVFNLLFAAASRALLQFARDYDRLRAQVGFTAVLHTWDQNLNFHPHLHIVVTGGGLSVCADTWIAASNSFLLSRYTHRVAISNHRLASLADGKVTFRARDNSRPGQQRLVTTTAQEFIRRFLLHILPPRFVKIRHFGLRSFANAKTKLEKARSLLGPPESASHDELKEHNLDGPPETKSWQEMMRALTGVDFTVCPQCGRGRLIRCQLTVGEPALAPAIWDSS